MIEEEGIVMKVDGEKAFIKSKKNAACSDCGSKSLCKGMGDDVVMVEAENEAKAHVGDLVIFCIPESTMFKAGIFLYFIPLMFFTIGSSLGYYYGDNLIASSNPDFMALVFGFLSIFVAYYFVRMYYKNDSRKVYYTPTIVRVINSGH